LTSSSGVGSSCMLASFLFAHDLIRKPASTLR
jgi:hypothetical protein